MIRKILSSIRHMQAVTGFDSYLSSIQMHGGSGAPTVDEARKDYLNSINTENAHYTK